MMQKLFRRIKVISKLKYCLLLAGCTLSLFAFAATELPVVTVLKGSLNQIKVDSVRETFDPVYYSSNSSFIDNPANDKYLNSIALLIDEDDRTFIPADFTATIVVEITWTDLNGVLHSAIQKTLEIDYKIAEGTKYNARNYFHFDNSRRVNVKIISIDTHNASWDITKVLLLENRMEIKRDYLFSCSQTMLNLSHAIGDISSTLKFDELVISWNAQAFKGITHYDLEWAWVDIDALDRYKINSQFNDSLIFKNNSTRVTFPGGNSSYKVPLIYDGNGYLFYRARPVQYRENGLIVDGSWKVEGSSGIAFYHFINGHEDSLSWQVSTTYAEDGKRKTVIQYFDGTLRSRQTVTKDNVNNNPVIAETFYDYQGRPAINVLPSPTLNTVIEYAKNFNRFSLTTDAKDIFDLVPLGQTICNTITPPLDSATGASNYYSQLNPRVNTGINKYIPDADGYAYAETRYTPDATGRIAAQGGVGSDFQLGTNHETKYYYGSADQRELNALFGTEVGDNSHYFKNMVRDANGQFSVSYVDMHGRTIATALAGNPPANLKPLDSYQPQYLTKNLIANGNNIIKGRSIESSTTLLVPKAGNHEFYYELNPQSAEIIACNPAGQSVCYDCYYDLEIRITGDCGQAPIVITRSNFTFGNYDTSCNTTPLPLIVNETYLLTEGEYNITKKLTLSKDAQDWYRDSVFAKKNICKTLQQFYNEIYQVMLADSSCNVNCETCTATIGTYEEYRTRFLQELDMDAGATVPFEAEILTSFKEASANCQALCNPIESKLNSIREQMLEDMTPDAGQYARTDQDLNDDGDMLDEEETNTNKPYNIFHDPALSIDSTSLNAPFRNPKDALDNPISFYPDEFDQYNETTTPGLKDHSLTPTEFSSQFGTNWAKALLYYHPEYCKLKIAEQFLPNSYTWDETIEAIDTWQMANTAGYVDNILNLDPFFNGPGLVYKNAMQQSVTVNYRNTGKSMWQIAIMSVNCLNTNDPSCANGINPAPPYTANTCTGDWNNVWRIFRSMYLSEKDSLVNEYLTAQCPSIKYKELEKYKYKRRFGNSRQLSSEFNTLMGQLDAFISNGGNPQAGGAAISDPQVATIFEETCEGYIDYWKTKLLACDQLHGHADSAAIIKDIIKGLKSVCLRGIDLDHPNGSSTVKPGDTNPPQSFEQVISAVFTQYDIDPTAFCHPYLIDYPQPYTRQSPLSDDLIFNPKDSCVCGRITELKAEQTQAGYSGSLSEFIEYQHQVSVRQTFLDSLINGCNGSPDCNTYDPPIEIPAILSCTTSLSNCIECKEYDSLKLQFKTKFPLFSIIYEGEDLTEEQVNQNQAFASFINSRTGINKTWSDFLSFEKACIAYNDTWNCNRLDSIVTAFYIAHPNTGSGDSCRYLFTQYFNTAFGTAYSFPQIQQLFMTYCGHLPDVCEAVLDCKGFSIVIDSFYLAYGDSIATAINCQELFVDFFNNYYHTNYTWDVLVYIYKSLCGNELNVCTPFPCDRLQWVIDSWFGCHNNAWMNPNCLQEWVTYFNAVMSTNLEEWEIAAWYKGCNISYSPCQPPNNNNCTTLNALLDEFMNGGLEKCLNDTTIAIDRTCDNCFTLFINEHLGSSYSYEQIAMLYLKTCGTVLQVCENNFKPDSLSNFSAGFIKGYAENPDTNVCDSLFTTQFNQAFGVSYTFDRIMNVYLLYTGSKPELCSKQTLLTCDELESIHSSFFKLYPNPKFYFADSCQQGFRKFFNQLVGDTLSYEDISLYYGALCGRILNVCDSTNCDTLQIFANEFNAAYGASTLPQQLCRDLFTHLFNKQFVSQTPHLWPDIKKLYDSCYITLNNCPADSSKEITLDKLLGAKKAFYALNEGRLIEDCNKVFTDLFNQYFKTSFTNYQQLNDWVKDNFGINYELCGSLPSAAKMVLRSVIPEELPLFSAPSVPQSMPPRLCNTLPLFPTVVVEEGDPCDYLQTLALNAATEQHNVYLQKQYNRFDSVYKNKCLSAATAEIFTVRSEVAEYHYTLYYYDQAGSLVKTIPPAGAHPDFSDNFNTQVEAAKISGASVMPAHTLPTQYRYNTLGQVIAQKSPDGGLSKFLYDILGRLVVSQNAKQATGNKYSYTKYDILGRITEVGQLNGTAITQAITQDPIQLQNWFTAANNSREQITQTVYDVPQTGLCSPPPSILCQQNLRNRVSYTTLTDLATDADYASATYFTYDIHGNVDILLQHYNKGIMQAIGGNAFKKITYKYDLISGKVNEVAYQPGLKDQFYHRYEYDAENKLVKAFTSPDYVYWEQQADYTYYRHGPLARTELGQLGVQGTDYVYNLQGWMKGVNTTGVTAAGVAGSGFDVGGDGALNGRTAKDAYGFSLNYHLNDYKPINNTVTPFAGVGNGLAVLADGVITGKDLFNGNIKAMLVNIPKLTSSSANEGIKLYGYQYDQLNRITGMNAYNGMVLTTNTFTPVALDDYKERITYDANGNILSYLRNGSTLPPPGGGGGLLGMDSMTYNYYGNSNRLSHVNDAVAATNYTTDIDDQAAANYDYDEIGNLIKDNTEGIANNGIFWNVYGKIASVTKTVNGISTSIFYTYDASGNRIGKRVHKDDLGITQTWYVRDASGNVMAVYENNNGAVNNGMLTQTEVHLYGSSRLGLWKAEREVQTSNWWMFTTTAMPGTSNGGYTETFTRGKTVFELSNHLQNVLVTVSDKKIGVDANSDGTIDYYNADVASAQDFYPFGFKMPGRQWSNGSYRYGFNGREEDDEVKGDGNSLDYKNRIYDPRVGRFLSVDPIADEYPQLAPYQFASNQPIESIDMDGMERWDYRAAKGDDGKAKLTFVSEGPKRGPGGRILGIRYEGREIPPHIRIEYNGQHYVFIDGRRMDDLAYHTPEATGYAQEKEALHYMADYKKFLTNPDEFAKTHNSEEQVGVPDPNWGDDAFVQGVAELADETVNRPIPGRPPKPRIPTVKTPKPKISANKPAMQQKVAATPNIAVKQKAAAQQKSIVKPPSRAPEFPGGQTTETGFLNSALNWLGKGYKDMGGGRYVSADGLKQIRYGKHETTGKNHHGHFETYDKPADQGGKVTENTMVKIVPDTSN